VWGNISCFRCAAFRRPPLKEKSVNIYRFVISIELYLAQLHEMFDERLHSGISRGDDDASRETVSLAVEPDHDVIIVSVRTYGICVLWITVIPRSHTSVQHVRIVFMRSPGVESFCGDCISIALSHLNTRVQQRIGDNVY
jgi:hypothetical protein